MHLRSAQPITCGVGVPRLSDARIHCIRCSWTTFRFLMPRVPFCSLFRSTNALPRLPATRSSERAGTRRWARRGSEGSRSGEWQGCPCANYGSLESVMQAGRASSQYVHEHAQILSPFLWITPGELVNSHGFWEVPRCIRRLPRRHASTACPSGPLPRRLPFWSIV